METTEETIKEIEGIYYSMPKNVAVSVPRHLKDYVDWFNSSGKIMKIIHHLKQEVAKWKEVQQADADQSNEIIAELVRENKELKESQALIATTLMGATKIMEEGHKDINEKYPWINEKQI